jgi:nucleoside phosphorylase
MYIERIRKGMHVIDVNGKNVGVVEDLKFGDTAAASSEGQNDLLASSGGADRVIAAPVQGFPIVMESASSEHADLAELPPEQAERLLRLGYIKVKTGHILHGHRFFASDEIADIRDDNVRLTRESN